MVELRNLINSGCFTPPVLLFVQSKERAEELVAEFRKQTHIKVESIHSDK
jgi:ATP-dependent RNA helicase DDX52/ROK1